MDRDILKEALIFHGLSDAEVDMALKGLGATEKKYKKGAVILHAGETTDRMGLITEGSVTIENNDVWGNKTILSHVGAGGFFAETYGMLSGEALLVDVVANESCSVVFLTIGKLHRFSSKSEAWISKLTANLLKISMQKNLILSGRNFHTSPRTIRGKVMAYLGSVYIQEKKTSFCIPFDRQQLADYLNVDRTALSKELGKMRDEGLIDFHKNHFKILSDLS